MNTRTLLMLAGLSCSLTALADPGTAFSFQGELRNAGTPASGLHDLRFRLFDTSGGSAQIGGTLCADNIAVADGVFVVSLDFGDVFSNGDSLFLEIDVRADTGLNCSNATGYTTLAPRQSLSITPFAGYATQARNANNAESADNASQLGGQSPTFYRNAANLNAGTLADARLTANVPRLNAANSFTGAVTMSNPLNSFAGVGAGLTSLNASALSSGTVPGTVLEGTYPSALTMTNTSNIFGGSGAALTGLNATALASGAVPNGRLLGQYTNILTIDNALNTLGGNGAAITNLNAANLASGTLPSARFSGSYTNAVSITNVANTFAGNGAGLFNIDASGIGTGTLPGARLSGTYSGALAFNNASNQFTGAFSGSGAGLTGMGANNLTTGSLNDARLSSNVPLKNAANTFVQNCIFSNALSVGGNLSVGGTVTADALTLSTPAARVYVVGRFDFLPGEETLESDNPFLGSGLTPRRYAAMVHLPHGAVVTGVRLDAIDDATGDMTAFLLRRGNDGTAGGTMAQVTSSGNTSGVRTFSDTSVSAAVVDNTGFQYIVRLDTPAVSIGGCNMRAIRIEYTMSQPMP